MECLLYLTTMKIEDRSNRCYQRKCGPRANSGLSVQVVFFLCWLMFGISLLMGLKQSWVSNLMWFSAAIMLSQFARSKKWFIGILRHQLMEYFRQISLMSFRVQVKYHLSLGCQLFKSNFHFNSIFFLLPAGENWNLFSASTKLWHFCEKKKTEHSCASFYIIRLFIAYN